MNIKKTVSLGLFTAIALIIFVIEAWLPPLTPIPGIKPGLANIITLTVLCLYGRKEAFAVLILRIVLGSVFAGTAVSMIYSLSGGILSFAVMSILMKFIDERSLWVISAFGAIAHNVGQLAAAFLMTSTPEIFGYAPILIISGIVTGVFTGVAAGATLRRIRRDEGKIIK